VTWRSFVILLGKVSDWQVLYLIRRRDKNNL